MISTRQLQLLPASDQLKRLCQSIAMLDAVLGPEWESRYYSSNARWDTDEAMASMRDGSGDSYFVLFAPQGTILKGYAHESPMAAYAVRTGQVYPAVLDSVPDAFADFLSEPAFSLQETTFCIWRQTLDQAWNIGPIQFPAGNDPDGSEALLSILDGNPQTYLQWSEEYYEVSVSLAAVRQIYEHKPITKQLIQELNPEVTLADLAEDIEEIGYPK